MGFFTYDFFEVVGGVVDGYVCSQRTAQVQLFLSGGGGNDLCAPGFGQLNRHGANARGPGLHQNRITWLHLAPGFQQMVGRQKYDGHSPSMHWVDGFRVRKDQVPVYGNVFGLSAGSHRHHLLPHGDPVDRRPNFDHSARRFQSQGGGQVGAGIVAAPAHDVGVVDPRRLHFDEDLVGPWRGLRSILPLEDIQAAEFVDTDRFHSFSLLIDYRRS